jgi:hypothetical protein
MRSWLANPALSVTEQMNQIRDWVKSEASTKKLKVIDALAERYQEYARIL